MSPDDVSDLEMAAEVLNRVMDRHNKDLRILAIFCEALQDIRIGSRYIESESK